MVAAALAGGSVGERVGVDGVVFGGAMGMAAAGGRDG